MFMTNRQKLINSTVLGGLGTGNCAGFILHARTRLSLASRRTIRSFFTTRGPRCIFLTTTRIKKVITGDHCQTSFVCRGLVVRGGIVRTSCLGGMGGLLFLKDAYVCPKGTPRPVPRSYLLASPLRCAGRPCTVTGVTKVGVYRDCGLRCKAGCVTMVPAGLCNPGSGFGLRASRILPTVVHGMRLNGYLSRKS